MAEQGALPIVARAIFFPSTYRCILPRDVFLLPNKDIGTIMQISYSVENIRRLSHVEPIEIRPITVLVGRNSAGKSTFLRSLPLIRQSIETRSSAPILWYGDYVDFGDFKTATSGNDKTEEAVFSFKISDLSAYYRTPVSYRVNAFLAYRRQKISLENINIRYFVGAESGKTVLKKIRLEIPSENIECEISYRGRSGTSGTVVINGEENSQISLNHQIVNVNNNLFSQPFLLSKTKNQTSGIRRRSSYQAVLAEELKKVLKREIKRISSDDTFDLEVANILTLNGELEHEWDQLISNSSTITFSNFYTGLKNSKKSKLKDQIYTFQKAFRSLQALDVVNERLTTFFRGVGYLGPARAASERYYRKQELEVSEILPNGSNFPMFLDSLSDHQKHAFSEWVENIFGYGVELASFEGHISINLRAGKNSVNVTDTGYGVSQILPVLGLIWWAGHRPRDRSIPFEQNRSLVRTLAIEQPELHLHPAHQAKLADVFAQGVKRNKHSKTAPQVNLIIETHSEALINRLGELIEMKVLDKNDVQIVIFSAEDDINSPTKVSLANFDSEGTLSNWPFGFFNYSTN